MRPPWQILLCTFGLWVGAVCGPVCDDGLAQDRMRAPREERAARAPGSQADSGSLAGEPMRFFRTTISRVDGDRCPMFPTCSQYGEQAIRRHGSILGILMVVDRLFHEWSETGMAPKVTVYGVTRYWDPLDENDFWFGSGQISVDHSRGVGKAP